MLHSIRTLVFSPSGALCIFSPSNHFGSTIMSPIGENGIAPLEGGSESRSRVEADLNCLLHILAFPFISVLRIPFSLSDVIPNARLF